MRGKLSLAFVMCVLLLLVLSFSQAEAAAPLDSETCEPFNPDGSARPSKDCPCSEVPDSDQYCMSGTDYLIYEIVSRVELAQLSLMETASRWYWLLARIVKSIAAALMSGEAWRSLRDALIGSLVDLMGGQGGVLMQLVGGPQGLFGIALLLAGLLLVFPMLQEARLVKVERVIVWGVFLLALFIFSATGFDLIEGIESLRLRLMETAAGTGEPQALAALIARPMFATMEEAAAFDEQDLLVLPAQFEQTYFKPLRECDPTGASINCGDYRRVRVLAASTFMDALEFIFSAEVVQTKAMALRQEAAREALVRVGFALYTTYALGLFALLFGLLAAAALLLVIFFVTALPLGFFEFGGTILTSAIQQYTAVTAWSLFVSIFLRLQMVVFEQVLGEDFSLTGMLYAMAIVTVVLFILQLSLRQVWGLMDGTLGLVGNSIRAVGAMALTSEDGPLTQATRAASGALNTAVTATVAAGAGALTGGVGTALVAGAGGLLQGTRAGHTVADMAAAAAPESASTRLFSQVVYGGAGAALSGIVARPRQDKPEVVQYSSQPLDQKWGAAAMDDHLTTDLSALAEAENSFFRDQRPYQAQRALGRAFGSQAAAGQALAAYQSQGLEGARHVRRAVEIAQATAEEWSASGRAIFDAQGGLAGEFQAELRRSLSRLSGGESEGAVRLVALAASAIRRPARVWEDPQAARKLARDTLDPGDWEVQVEDASAQLRLRDLAQRLGWGVGELEMLYAALPSAEGADDPEQAVVACLRGEQAFTRTSDKDLHEAARLARLVGASAQVQQPGRMDSEPDEAIQESAEQTFAPDEDTGESANDSGDAAPSEPLQSTPGFWPSALQTDEPQKTASEMLVEQETAPPLQESPEDPPGTVAPGNDEPPLLTPSYMDALPQVRLPRIPPPGKAEIPPLSSRKRRKGKADGQDTQ